VTFVKPICGALRSCKVVVENLAGFRLDVVFPTHSAKAGEDLVVNAFNKHHFLKGVETVWFGGLRRCGDV
jgi:hypothetical protein